GRVAVVAHRSAPARLGAALAAAREPAPARRPPPGAPGTTEPGPPEPREPGTAGTRESAVDRVVVLAADLVKGLEYDHVVVAEPAAITAAEARGLHRLYVVLTRAVSRLDVVHVRPLPPELTGPDGATCGESCGSAARDGGLA
ncbi:hypothetical protein ACFW15_16350, partial [Streptomyces sp. NPDC058953]